MTENDSWQYEHSETVFKIGINGFFRLKKRQKGPKVGIFFGDFCWENCKNLVHFVNFWHELIVFYKFQELILNAQIISILLPSKKSWYSTYFFQKLIKRASKCAKVTKSLFSQLINCFNDRFNYLKKFWQKMIGDNMSIQKFFSKLKLMEIFHSKNGKKDQKLAFFGDFCLENCKNLVHFVNFWHELIVLFKFRELILNAHIISILSPSKKLWYSTYFFQKLIKRASKCVKVTKSIIFTFYQFLKRVCGIS